MNMNKVKVNLGCGSQTPKGWINVDYAFGARLAKLPILKTVNRRLRLVNLQWDHDILIHDLRTSFPWGDGSVDVIYSSHTLEHFTKEHGRLFLKECYRVLKPAGIIRIVVPDLATLVSGYLNGAIPAEDFVDKMEVSYEAANDSMVKRKLAPFVRFPHKCMYDSNALIRIMGEIGFIVSGREPYNSEISDIRAIELAERVQDAVIVEGKK